VGKVSKPKQYGGLGVKYLKIVNATLLGKWRWKLGTEREEL